MSTCFAAFPGVPDSVAEARKFVAGALRLAPETEAPDAVVAQAIPRKRPDRPIRRLCGANQSSGLPQQHDPEGKSILPRPPTT